MLRAFDGAEVAHQLRGAFRDERAALPELLGVYHSVVALVRSGQARETCRHAPSSRTCPRIHDAAAHARAVTVHVLRGESASRYSRPI